MLIQVPKLHVFLIQAPHYHFCKVSLFLFIFGDLIIQA